VKRVARKVFVSGSSYIISLPKEWVIENSIEPGDTVFVNIGKRVLIVSPETEISERKEALIEGERNPSMLSRKIISYYLAGYTRIMVKTEGQGRSGIVSALKSLIGAEILEDSGESVWIEIFVDEKRFKISELLEKMANTVYSMMDDFQRCITEFDRERLEILIQREQEVDRLYFLILRLLKSAIRFSDIADSMGTYPKEILGMRIVLKNVERVADHLYVMADNLNEYGREIPELSGFSEKSFRAFRVAMNSFFKIDQDLSREVFEMIESLELPGMVDVKDTEDMLRIRRIEDGLERILGYSEDIAEITMNLSV